MLQILKNDYFEQVKNDVLSIALDPIVEVDLDTGIVYYDFQASSAKGKMGSDTVFRLAARTPKTFVGLRGQESTFSAIPKPNMKLRDIGGFTIFDDPLEPTQIEIVYDVQRCGGYGTWVEGVIKDDKIDMPTHVMLLHEMRHAAHLLDGGFSWDETAEEDFAIEGENAYRQQIGLSIRGGHGGGCKESVGFWGSYKQAGGGGGGGCFIATAAYGSELDPNVEFLRRFRDDVIRTTRMGEEFWDRYWERYARISPTIVEIIESDPEVRELVRWSLVEPIVHYLELVQSFPDASLAGVPEPWASWLAGQRETLTSWLEGVALPTEYDGMELEAVVAELTFVLRYILRTADARDGYVGRLRESGALPLRVDGPTRDRLAEQLASTPATADRVDSILEERRPPILLRAYGGQHVFSQADLDLGEWLYTVTVRNDTAATFTEVVIFYARTNADGVVYLSERDFAPGEVRVFSLGVCNLMKSYVLGCFIGEDMVAKIPDAGELTAAVASTLNPDDDIKCADSWVIKP